MWRINRIGYQMLSFLLVAFALGVAVYMLFCDQVGRLSQMADQTTVTLAGRVTECHPGEHVAGPGVYRLEDPTGDTYVVTSRGVPAEKSLIFIRGTKRTKNEQTVIVETHRLAGTF